MAEGGGFGPRPLQGYRMKMNRYRVLDVLTVRDGVVGLDLRQAARRLHKVIEEKAATDKGMGEYRLTAPTEFKRGEVVGLADVSKVAAAKLEPVKARSQRTEPTPTAD